MSFNFSAPSLEEIHQILLHTLHDDFDFRSAPRGKAIKELVAATFTLDDPRNRLILSPARNVNYGFAVGELCWYIRGDTDLGTMLYYNKRMSQFSDDGVTINSAYGARMLNGAPSQFDDVVEELKRDPDSRRAVMHINQPHDLHRAVDRGSKDVPCTMSIQLLIRDRRLHMHVLMRSNDVVWGMPYDVFSFTCLQEAFLYVLQKEGVPVDDLGAYHHTAGSLHVYETHFGLAEEVSKENLVRPAPMKPFTREELEWLANEAEPKIRASAAAGGIDWMTVDPIPGNRTERPAGTIDWMVSQLADHRHKRVLEKLSKEKNVESP